MEETILVTGATGHSGGYVLTELIKKGRKVRALVHRQDDRSKAVASQGAEVVVGDLLNLKDVRSAMHGVTAGYFLYPVHPSIVGASAIFAQSAKENGLELVANMTQLPAKGTTTSPASLNHWLAEEVFNWSGVPVAHIRASFFLEWVLWCAPFVKATGKLIMPWEATSHVTLVATEDLGRAIAQILTQPKEYVGKYVELVGPQVIAYGDLAEILSRVLGRNIPYEHLEAGPFTENAGLGEYLRDHVRETSKGLPKEAFGVVKNNLIEEITGTAPITPEEFLRKNQAAFVA
jgi:NAD(P)H dehydrogenase (quinone)